MKKLVIFMHVSLDGFVGGPNGEMDWIRVDDEMFDYAGRLTHDSDVALYGRVTYNMMDAYWPTAADQPNASKHDIEHSNWYNSVHKVVVSNSMKGKKLENVTILNENIPNEILRIKQQPGKNIAMFGSPTVGHFLMQHNLIDDYWLFINPIILGTGIPMFTGIKEKIDLTLVESKTFSSGVVGLHYQKKSEGVLHLPS
ncbi:MAG: dihydrofolate reductase family protein [Ignavibacteriae bacterium]|nr:dihydrofolate reductase family protein [Ignavibacteriota bacterium]